MRRSLAAITLALAAAAAAYGQTSAEGAQKELDAGAQAFRERRFAEAERHFRRALELDPEGKNTRLLVARAAQQQYKPDDPSPENVAAGERAVAAYQEVLAKEPANEDAYKAVLYLYTQMKNEQKVNEFLLGRANDFSLPEGRRAEAFTVLAGKQWKCSHDVTEQKVNKTTEQKVEQKPEQKPGQQPEQKAENKPEKPVVKYKMPADQGDFIRARQCMSEGLQLAEQAVALAPKSPNAWSYKANLLREAAKLAEMEGDAAGHAEYTRQYEEASGRQRQLAQEQRQAKPAEGQAAGQPGAAAAGTPRPAAPPRRAGFTGGILNSKATSKPMPPYPPEAKAAGVQGTVVVRVTVDEAGKVAEAEAISGPPPLREAAVAAARRALFAPTLLSGKPVRVTGVLTYQFVLPK